MKKIIIKLNLIMGLTLLFSCSIKKQVKIKYQTWKGGDKYLIQIPSGYNEEFRISGDNEYSQEYLYADSASIYLTTFHNTNNYEEIRKQGSYYSRFDAIHTSDTITLMGKDINGLYWKDKLFTNGLTVGYSKVKKENKDNFEKAINTLIKKN